MLATRTTRLIAVGEQVKLDLLRVGIGRPEQFEVIPPGLQLGPIPSKEHARTALGLRLDQLVICFIGRLTPIKRIDRLIDVIRLTYQAVPDVKFVVAGEGTELEQFQDTRNRGLPILTLGWRSDVERILAASDIMVLTSDNERTPVSLIQAGLAGIPVVSTDVGSVSDVVRDGQSGILTSSDPMQITRALVDLITAPHIRQRIGAFAQTECAGRYGSQQLLDKHLAIYRSLFESSRKVSR